MKSVYLVYIQDQKHKRTITESKNSAVEEKAAATKRCTLTQAKSNSRQRGAVIRIVIYTTTMIARLMV